MNLKNEFVIAIAGKAGQGVLSMGDFIQHIAQNVGLYSFVWVDYPSLIKGGHNVVFIRISDKPIHAPVEYINYLIALDAESVDIHWDEITKQGVLIYDSDIVKKEINRKPNKNQTFFGVGVPFNTISRGINKSTRYSNTAAISVLHYVLGWELGAYAKIIEKKFKKKSQQIVDDNINAMKQGYEYTEDNYDNVFIHPLGKGEAQAYYSIDGSQALAFGAIKAGVKFTAAYPMTPATPIFDHLAANAEKYGIIAKQAEDEISAICMTIGASYAGARSITMSSGGGFSLMVEAIGLAGITETPLVVVNAMRGGPSTGLPTKTEQSDLRFVLHSSQGEFPRVVMAPGDSVELYQLIQEAFNLADLYQLPVIVLTDKYLATSQMIFPKDTKLDAIDIDRGVLIHSKDELGAVEKYARYLFTKDGVSPRALPGSKEISFHSGSDEHNEYGEICEDAQNRVKMMDKRMQKEKTMLPSIPKPKVYGNTNADITIISWGSTKWAAIEAIDLLAEHNIIANVMHFNYIYPFNISKTQPLLDKVKKSMVIENNATGQFVGLLKQYFDFKPEHSLLKYDGHPFYPDEIAKIILNKMF
ncbi:MAG: 2-oxoacid:acceptor oxidoreductase subunit alpha [Candidatus Paceibacterota bacterium]